MWVQGERWNDLCPILGSPTRERTSRNRANSGSREGAAGHPSQKVYRQNGMLWENYTNDWKPISVDWQNQPMETPESSSPRTSHVSIGGHTAMAPQQIIE